MLPIAARPADGRPSPTSDAPAPVGDRPAVAVRGIDVARVHRALEASPDGFAILDAVRDGDRVVDFRVAFVNEAALRPIGAPAAADVVGQTIRALAPALADDALVAHYAEVLAQGRPLALGDVALDGEVLGRPVACVLALHAAPLDDDAIALTFRDVTDATRDAAARERERALLTRVTEATPDLVYVYDVQLGRNTYANRTLGDLLGWSQAEIAALGDRLFATLMHPDDLPRTLAQLDAYARNLVYDGEIMVVEYRMRRADGRWRWFRGRELVLSRSDDGRVREVLGIAQDVTARVDAETERARMLAEATAARAAAERAADRTMRLQRVTAALARLLTPEEVTALVVAEGCAAVGTPYGVVGLLVDDAGGRAFALNATQGRDGVDDAAWQRFPVDLPIPFGDAVRTRSPVVLATADEYAARYPLLADNVARCRVTGAIVVPLETDGRVHGAMGVDLVDGRTPDPADVAYLVTLGQQCAQALERARLIAAERAARAEAERANRAKSEFLATMSHELRTPLNAIGGHVQLVTLGLHGPVTEAQHAALARVERAQRHLLGLIEHILNFARLEAGRVEYRVADVAVGALLDDVAAMLEPQMAARGLAFAVEPPPTGLAVRADREKLGQVLLNLLSNAAKFTPAGGRVTLAARSAPADPSDAASAGVAPRVHLIVADTGAGIAADQLETIFEPFVQLRGALPGRPEGTGLGLAISRDLARGMGGDLVAASTPGAGSTFTVVLDQS